MISLTTQLQLLERLGTVPLGPLVDALRELHAGGPASDERLRSLVASTHVTPPPGAGAGAPGPARPPVGLGGNVDYEAARRHFADHARRLREQAMLAERLLEGLVRRQSASPATSLQHCLELTGKRGSPTSAAFVVVNADVVPIHVRFDVTDTLRGVDEAVVAQSLSFDPPTPRLMPGEDAVVRLSLNLRDYRAPGELIELGVDVRGGDRLLVRLWIRVRITEEETREGGHLG